MTFGKTDITAKMPPKQKDGVFCEKSFGGQGCMGVVDCIGGKPKIEHNGGPHMT